LADVVEDRVLVNCPLVDPHYPAEWMAETQFRTVLITLLDIDGIGHNWEDSNKTAHRQWIDCGASRATKRAWSPVLARTRQACRACCTRLLGPQRCDP